MTVGFAPISRSVVSARLLSHGLLLGPLMALGPATARAAIASDDSSPSKAIESGAAALDSSWRYPWYDSATDDLRRVELSVPWEWPDWWPQWSWDWSWLQGLGGLGDVLYYAVWALVVAALAWAVYRMVRTLLDREAGPELEVVDRAIDQADRARIEALPFDLAPSHSDLLAEARRRAERGDFTGAIVYLYSHQLVELDRRQVIRLARGKTNRQYLREARRRTGLVEVLEPCMIAFEEAFFGHRALSRQRYDECWLALERLTALTSEASR